MTTYIVDSSRLAGHARGDTVDDSDLVGCNVAALVAGGHLVPDETSKKNSTDQSSQSANSAKSNKE